MLIYAFLTEQFVVTLFIAGVIPVLLTILIYFMAIQIVVKPQPVPCTRRPQADMGADRQNRSKQLGYRLGSF